MNSTDTRAARNGRWYHDSFHPGRRIIPDPGYIRACQKIQITYTGPPRPVFLCLQDPPGGFSFCPGNHPPRRVPGLSRPPGPPGSPAAHTNREGHAARGHRRPIETLYLFLVFVPQYTANAPQTACCVFWRYFRRNTTRNGLEWPIFYPYYCQILENQGESGFCSKIDIFLT